jgi:3-dehydroquinate synthase
MHKEKETLLEVIHESVSFKCKNVEHSITHPVVRDLLNFGHTIAHAIEYGEGPSYPHGMAVAQGIIAECSIAHERGVLSKQAFDDICVAMQPLRLPRFSMKKYQGDLLEKALMADKKTKNGTPHIVLLQDIGKPLCLHDRYAHPVTLQECRRALEKLEACNL